MHFRFASRISIKLKKSAFTHTHTQNANTESFQIAAFVSIVVINVVIVNMWNEWEIFERRRIISFIFLNFILYAWYYARMVNGDAHLRFISIFIQVFISKSSLKFISIEIPCSKDCFALTTMIWYVVYAGDISYCSTCLAFIQGINRSSCIE